MALPSVLFKNAKFHVEIEHAGMVATIRLVGVLNEDVNLSTIYPKIPAFAPGVTTLKFDLGHVDGLNSCGVREWLLLMERMPATYKAVFENVNELFVEQANMIANIFGKRGNPVISFQAPFHCGKCNTDVTLLVDPKQVERDGERPIAPKLKCKTCGGLLEFDSIEDEYFGFVKRI